MNKLSSIESVFRGVGITVLIIVSIAASVMGTIIWRTWESDRARERERAAVSLVAEMENSCPAETPVRISVRNGGTGTLRYISFRLAIYEYGSSDNLTWGSSQMWHEIVDPGAMAVRCWPLPSLTREGIGSKRLSAHAEISFVDLFRDGEHIPPH